MTLTLVEKGGASWGMVAQGASAEGLSVRGPSCAHRRQRVVNTLTGREQRCEWCGRTLARILPEVAGS